MNKMPALHIVRLLLAFVLIISILVLPVAQARPASAQTTPTPHMDMWLDGNSVSAFDWPIGASLTLTIVDAQNGSYTDTQINGTASWNPGQGFFKFEIPANFPLRPGQQVTTTDGTTTINTVVADLQPPIIDVENDQISGSADEGARLWIYLCNRDDCIYRSIVVDASGTYLFDFSEPGLNPGETQTLNLYPGDASTINWDDGNGNNTSRDWRIPNPRISANVNRHWVNAHDYPEGETLTLKINGVTFGTAVVGPASWNPSDILANFNPPVLHAGDVLTISNPDQSITKSLTLADLLVTNIHLATSTLSGFAPPNARIQVGVNSPTTYLIRHVQADASGFWSTSFATAGTAQGDAGTTTFGPNVSGWVDHSDEDGDQTSMGWNQPHINVFLDSHSVAGYDWPVGANLTLTVTKSEGLPYTATAVNGGSNGETVQGFYSFSIPQDIPLTPGQQVTISDGTLSQTTTIKDLRAPDVDILNSRISGTAGAGALISTCINSVWPCIPRATTAEADGSYVLDFSIPGSNEGEGTTYTFQPNTGGMLHWGDGLGNNTARYWKLPNYTIHAVPHGQEVHGHDWPVGEVVTLTLYDPDTEAQKTATSTVVDIPNQCGMPCFWMDEIGWTLAEGQVVSLSNDLFTQTVIISPLTITRIDALHDQMAGIASPNSNITLAEFSPDGTSRFIQADAAGNWMVDFSVPGLNPNEGKTVDLNKNSGGRVLQLNPGWNHDNGTLQYWSVSDPMILSSTDIDENAPAASVVGTFSPAYPEVTQTLVYSLVAGEGDGDNAAFSIVGNQLRMNASPNYESKAAYSIRVRVVDTNAPGKSYETTYTITVNNLVEAPTVTSFSKSGLSGSPIPFVAANFNQHFATSESTSTGVLEKIRITALPTQGILKVGSGPNLTVNSEIPAASLGQLVYLPAASNPGNDSFLWTGADNTGYAQTSAQVSLTLGFFPIYGLQVSPAGDAKSGRGGTNVVYSLSLTNTGNTVDSYSVTLQGMPKWPTYYMPGQVTALGPNGQATLTVYVTLPPYASGSDEAVLKITSLSSPSKTVSVKLTTTAISAPITPFPVLFGVTPNSASASALTATTLTIAGAYFTDPMIVMVGGLPSPFVTRISSVQLTARVPNGLAPGRYPVVVCDTFYRCAGLPEAFSVLNNIPTAISVYPAQGHNDSANLVTILGNNLSAATTFTLLGAGPQQQPVGTQVAGGGVSVTIPAGLPAGTYDLRVCNQALCSTLASAYTSLIMVSNDFAAAEGDLWTSPVTIREGNTLMLGLNVHRLSGLGLASVPVAFYRDDPNVPANKISPATNPTTALLAAGSAESISVKWTPVGVTGAVKIFAVIDPDGLQTEVTRANNVVATTIQILPREPKDETAPVIDAMTINNGAETTGQKLVNLSLQATDNSGGSGLQSMNIIEREYNPSARQWVVVQETGWIPYQTTYQWNLSVRGGLHYLQAWVADNAGNTSELAQVHINYVPAQDTLTAGQVRVYRFELIPDAQQHFVLQTLAGDADLYVWDPDGNLIGASITTETIDRVDFTPHTNGLYQVEVYAYSDSTYSLDFQAAAQRAGNSAARLSPFSISAKPQRWQPTIMTQNEPLNNNPAVPAPITAWGDTYPIFLPAIRR